MAEQTLLTSYTPAVTNANDAANYSLGTTFYSTAPGWVLGVKWRFPDSLPTGTVSGKLWEVSGDDQLVASGIQKAVANFSSPVAGTVNEVRFSSAVPILANVVHVASIWTADRYVATTGYGPFQSGAGGIVSGNLRAPEPGTDPLGVGTLHNAKLNPNASHNFPHQSFGTSFYWVDVIFTTDDPNAATPKSTSDTALFTDLLALAAALSLSDSAVASDTVLRTASISPSDTLTATDAVSVTRSTPTTDTFTATDTAAVARSATITDTFTFTDTVSVTASYTIADTIAMTEAAGGIGQIIADNFSLMEQVAAAANLTVNEVVAAIDTVTRQIEGEVAAASPITVVRRAPQITVKKSPPQITIKRFT